MKGTMVQEYAQNVVNQYKSMSCFQSVSFKKSLKMHMMLLNSTLSMSCLQNFIAKMFENVLKYYISMLGAVAPSAKVVMV